MQALLTSIAFPLKEMGSQKDSKQDNEWLDLIFSKITLAKEMGKN